MNWKITNPEEYLMFAFARVKSMLERYLGVSGLDPKSIDVNTVESWIDATTLNDDPIEIAQRREFYNALQVHKGLSNIPDEGHFIRQAEHEERYLRLLGQEDIPRWLIWNLTNEISYSYGSCFVFCEGNNEKAARIVDRAITEISLLPIRIDTSIELRGSDPLFILDGYPRDDRSRLQLAVLLQAQQPFRALLLREIPVDGRIVWVFERTEHMAIEAEPNQKTKALTNFWRYIANIQEDLYRYPQAPIRLYEYGPGLQSPARIREIAKKDVLFIIRGALDRRGLVQSMDGRSWEILKNKIYEFSPTPGVGDSNY